MKTEKIFSAGIDIGTSTTKMVVSSFLLKNVAGVTHVPRIEIIEKTVLHQSPIIKTPFINKDIIDMKRLRNLFPNSINWQKLLHLILQQGPLSLQVNQPRRKMQVKLSIPLQMAQVIFSCYRRS